MKVVYSLLWVIFVFTPLTRRIYTYVPFSQCLWVYYEAAYYRFPTSLPAVIVDQLERLYLAGFVLLQLFITLFPLVTAREASYDSGTGITLTCIAENNLTCPEPGPLPVRVASNVASMEFLPLMLTSVYCAVGSTWAFLRLSVFYLRDM